LSMVLQCPVCHCPVCHCPVCHCPVYHCPWSCNVHGPAMSSASQRRRPAPNIDGPNTPRRWQRSNFRACFHKSHMLLLYPTQTIAWTLGPLWIDAAVSDRLCIKPEELLTTTLRPTSSHLCTGSHLIVR